MTDETYTSNLCTCWYNSHPSGADMFCKPEGGCGTVDQGGEEIVQASTKGMQCP
jgi:hypothetical protein